MRIWTLFFWQAKGKLAELEFGSWFLKYIVLKVSSFWFIFICINVHSYWLGILHNFFVIYFVALCSSSLWYRIRFDLQIFQHVLTQYFGFYVIMEVTLINHNWFMHQWNTYIYIYIVEYPSYIFCTISFILATQCTITWCRYSQNLMDYSTWFVTNSVLTQVFNAWWKRLHVPKMVSFQYVDRAS